MRINDYVSISMLHTNAMNQAMNQLQSTNTHLSSGKRINSSADDPSMMLRISRLESNLREQNAVQKKSARWDQYDSNRRYVSFKHSGRFSKAP